MNKVTQVQLQGIYYTWNGQDILVHDGVAEPWWIAGSALEKIELEPSELEPSDLGQRDNEQSEVARQPPTLAFAEPEVVLFSIDFQAQCWSLSEGGDERDIKLLDAQGQACAWLLATSLPEQATDEVLLSDLLLPVSVIELSVPVPGSAQAASSFQAHSSAQAASSVQAENPVQAVESDLAGPLGLPLAPLIKANTPDLAELLQDEECLFDSPATPIIDGASLSMAAVDDVLNWLAVYSQQD